jgi:uncharacterized membrane protein
MSINKDIPELIKAGVITEDTAERIQQFYSLRDGTSGNRLFIVFGVIGAILVGLGLILIIAHNWDELPRLTKTVFAFLPLIIGQGLCGFSLLWKKDSVAWRESSASFLFFSVGASISLISQIYNIPGNISSFMLTWMLLCLPLIYLMKSSVVSLLYLTGITFYACEIGYWTYPDTQSYIYWLLLILALPHYYLLYKEKSKSNFLLFHNWFIPISIIITLGTFANDTEELMFVAYFSLFGLFYLIGEVDFFAQQKPVNNSFNILGSLGTVVLLLTLSFDWFWESLISENFQFNKIISTSEFFVSTIVTLLAAGLLFVTQKGKAPTISSQWLLRLSYFF